MDSRKTNKPSLSQASYPWSLMSMLFPFSPSLVPSGGVLFPQLPHDTVFSHLFSLSTWSCSCSSSRRWWWNTQSPQCLRLALTPSICCVILSSRSSAGWTLPAASWWISWLTASSRSLKNCFRLEVGLCDRTPQTCVGEATRYGGVDLWVLGEMPHGPPFFLSRPS